MNKLLPWLNVEVGNVVDLEAINEQAIPETSGVYIMLSENTYYKYPWSESNGESPVFYIGQSSNLRRRLAQHRKYYLEARDNPAIGRYYPRYEYAAYHGCRLIWLTCRDAQSAKELETDLLRDFAMFYGAKPVANDQGSW